MPGPSHDVVIGPAGTVVTYAEATSAVHSLNCQNDLSLESGSLTLAASSVIAGALIMAAPSSWATEPMSWSAGCSPAPTVSSAGRGR